MKKVTVLGSTGSIGLNTLKVTEKMSHEFSVLGLAAGRNVDLIQEQIIKFSPGIVSVEREEDAEYLRKKYKNKKIRIVYGQSGAEEVACFGKDDTVVSAITGIAGLKPTLAAIKCGKKVALANKESMVVGGELINSMAAQSGAQLIPVDSEHSGIFQCLAKEKNENVRKVILTASGGPFFNSSIEDMKNKSLEDVLKHPRWKMGKKVTVDSATLMNKGFELIEAHWLFNLPPWKLDVLIHPQSIVHSLVELLDGSVLAQLSLTDMKIPIQYALTYPERKNSMIGYLDLKAIGELNFYEVDEKKFPLFKLARDVLEERKSYPVALNASNEVAVFAFLEKKIKFLDISHIVFHIVEKHEKRDVKSLDDIININRETKIKTQKFIGKRF